MPAVLSNNPKGQWFIGNLIRFREEGCALAVAEFQTRDCGAPPVNGQFLVAYKFLQKKLESLAIANPKIVLLLQKLFKKNIIYPDS